MLIFPAAENGDSKLGRPSLRTPETVAKICAAIREAGHTDTHAASLAGVSSSAVSRWRQEDEEFAVQLDAARSEYLDARLKEIREVRKRDGSIDWRAQAWLMQATAPEVYGPPSRRHSLARSKEEKKLEEVDDPNVLSPADLARCQQWRAFSLYKMNGMEEDEARWTAHFSHEARPPAYPGSLAIAGAVIPPPRELSAKEKAVYMASQERRLVALQATKDREEKERRALAKLRGEPEEEPVELETGAPEVLEPGRACPEVQPASDAPGKADPQNTTNVPESRGDLPAAAARGEGTPAPRTEGEREDYRATPESVSRRDAKGPSAADDASKDRRTSESGDDYLLRLLVDYRARNPTADVEQNGENLPESPKGGRTPERPAGARHVAGRPLTGAARAAAEAKEWRRINQQVEEQFQRDADRAMAVVEAASRDAIPGMWAGH